MTALRPRVQIKQKHVYSGGMQHHSTLLKSAIYTQLLYVVVQLPGFSNVYNAQNEVALNYKNGIIKHILFTLVIIMQVTWNFVGILGSDYYSIMIWLYSTTWLIHYMSSGNDTSPWVNKYLHIVWTGHVLRWTTVALERHFETQGLASQRSRGYSVWVHVCRWC